MQNISINSLGNFAGGEFDNVDIHGTGKCDGDMVCNAVQVYGTLKTDGFIRTQKLSVFGTLKCDGAIEAVSANIPGTAKADGNMLFGKAKIPGALSTEGYLQADTLSVPGSVKCSALNTGTLDCHGMIKADGDMKATRMKVPGYLKADGKIEAETIVSCGHIQCQTQISADRAEICGKVTADEIVGDYIEIKNDHHGILSGIKKLLGSNSGSTHITANLIEATTIILEGIQAGVVSGENVTIGENCRIDRLDCTGTYTIHPTSTVRLINGQPNNA